METTGYITKGAGYIALLSAIIEQAKHDAQSKDAADAADAKRGIKEWQNEVLEDINFNCYE